MMSVEGWEAYIKSAKVSAAAAGGRKQFQYTFADGAEMVEEYDSNSDTLLLRKWRRQKAIGGTGSWDVELGEEAFTSQERDVLVKESNVNPIFLRQDTIKAFQFRIRNLPYPIDTYKITAEGEQLVLRTSNKKYFKKFAIPDLQRIGSSLDASLVSMQHGNNTLVITYPKPPAIMVMEKRLRNERGKMKLGADGDVDCNTS
eukprot:TRINITY_DN8944_c0_g1_i4.p1 TRINITY_DN8944_c0_g1~~TRINITY_DN8944_c0_g1_i4.p1  ORF type:complete len:201 (+),score=34.61 TRINITY_DN8944_c0_g1_i4:165-767(+)